MAPSHPTSPPPNALLNVFHSFFPEEVHCFPAWDVTWGRRNSPFETCLKVLVPAGKLQRASRQHPCHQIFHNRLSPELWSLAWEKPRANWNSRHSPNIPFLICPNTRLSIAAESEMRHGCQHFMFSWNILSTQRLRLSSYGFLGIPHSSQISANYPGLVLHASAPAHWDPRRSRHTPCAQWGRRQRGQRTWDPRAVQRGGLAWGQDCSMFLGNPASELSTALQG